MDKAQIAGILEDIGTLLELNGENPFKSRAYHNAARIVAALREDLALLVQENKLSEISGIGEGLREKITTLVTTGRLPYYDELLKGLPPSLMEIIRIQGVGPKRAKILYEKLGVKDVPSLEKAATEGRIAKLAGFGAKTQENILKGIGFIGRHAEYHHFDEGLIAGEAVLAELKALPGVQRASLCGSLRRRREIVRDIDILLSAENPVPLMEAVTTLPEVSRVLAKGETKTSVLLNDGIQVDVRVVSDAAYPFALHYFTGSKEHNIVMRQLAQKKKLKLNEYGLFKSGDKAVPCKDERELFEKLGLAYIPPELREDRGEFAVASQGELPPLVEEDDIRGVFHVHSTWSDGKASLEDMIAGAEKRGWSYVGISDHSKLAAYANGLSEERVAQQKREIHRLRKKFKIHIFWGTECDILKDGAMDYPDKILADYDFVIASVHSYFQLPEAEMTKRIIRALRHPAVTILGHMSGRLLLKREPYAVNTPEVIEVAAKEGKAIELNADPRRFDMDWRHLAHAKERGIPISINPDAHSVHGLDVVRFGVGIARKGGLTKEDVLNARSLAEMTGWLRKRH